MRDSVLFPIMFLKLFLPYNQDVLDLNLNKFHLMMLLKEFILFVNKKMLILIMMQSKQYLNYVKEI